MEIEDFKCLFATSGFTVGQETTDRETCENWDDSMSNARGFLIAHCGMKDLTSQINLKEATEFPVFISGFANIYRAQMHTGPQVAIKAYRKLRELSALTSGWRIICNAHKWSKCRHHYINEVLGFTMFHDDIGLVSYWSTYGAVPDYLQKTPNADRLHLCTQICEGVSYLHQVGIVHGDIKGFNVLVMEDGNAKLIDFDDAVLEDHSSGFTIKEGVPGISIRWAAPELLMDLEGDSDDDQEDDLNNPVKKTRASDVYALGMTILEVTSGKLPWGNSTDSAIMRKICQGKIPDRPKEILEKGGENLWKLLIECWCPDPEGRPNAGTVLDVMNSVPSDSLGPLEIQSKQESGPQVGVPNSISTTRSSIATFSRSTKELRAILDQERRKVERIQETLLASAQAPHPRAPSPPNTDDQLPENEWRALASLGIQCAISLAEVASEIAPAPYIGLLLGSLTRVFQAVERTRVNKEQWKLLQGRCVMVLRISGAQVMNNGQQHYPGLSEATELLEKTLDTIAQRVEYYNRMSDTLAFLRYQAISEEIEGFFGQLDNCLRLFSYSADVAQAQWIGEFRAVQQQEIRDIEYLKKALQDINIDIQEVNQSLESKAHKLQDALRSLLDSNSAVLQAPDTATADIYVDAQRIVQTILSVTNLQMPPKLLLGRQCIPDSNIPIQTGITCDVYLASFLGGEKVAKKVFRLGISEQEFVQKYTSRFLRIAELWFDFRSDYTLPFYGIGMEPSGRGDQFHLYMVSPWMKNLDAMTYLKRYRDNSGMKKNILRIVTDAALGLQYLHNRYPPVVHSGMKGSNILISDSGGGILGGFGLSKALVGDESPDPPVVMTGKTDAMRWMAPEMFEEEPVLTTHCDVWGWAMATLEIISGLIPYHMHKQNITVMLKIVQGPPKRRDYPTFDHYAYKPDEMWSLLEQCWAQDPEERPTMDEVVVRLKKIARMRE